MENDNFEQFKFMGVFLIVSTIMLGVSFIMVVAGNDYVFAEVYDIASTMVSQGQMPADILTDIETITDYFLDILPFLDKIWFSIAIVFVWQYLRSSYLSKRRGYVSIFGILTVGIMFMLFGFNIVFQVNQQIFDVLFNQVLENLTMDISFFQLYINNFQIVNAFLIVAGVVANFVDLDTVTFFNKKNKERVQGGEIV